MSASLLRNPCSSCLFFALAISVTAAPAQAPPAKAGGPGSKPSWQRLLQGDDAQRAAELDQAIAAALNAGCWDEAIARAEERLALRARVQGPDHYETVDDEWYLKTLRRVAPMPQEDRLAYRSAEALNEQAEALYAQGKFTRAQPLLEKALAIRRRLLTDDHPDTARTYNNLASNLDDQGKHAAAQPLYERALAIRRRLLGDDHPDTALSYNNLASNLHAQGKYLEARDRWLSAAKGLDQARLRVAFTGLERAGTVKSPRPALAAVLARLGQPAHAWQALEEDLGRGLLDELATRQDGRLAPTQRDRLRELIADLERLDRLVEATPKDLDQAERARRFEDLRRQRERASIALGEFQARLVREHGALAGPVARLSAIQAALPADAALVAWGDLPPVGPNAADPDGEHWGVVVRARGGPAWVRLAGSGPHGHWTQDDTKLTDRVRTGLRRRPEDGPQDLRTLLARLRAQRLDRLAGALGPDADGLLTARRLIVLPSRALAGIPVEALLEDGDARTVSYAPSATVLKDLRERPRPDPQAGLLALGDPVYQRPDPSSEPQPLSDHGLLVQVVAPGSNAATRGLRPGDVLLAYNGTALLRRDDLKTVPEPGRPVPVETWRDGRVDRLELDPGPLGVGLDPRPAAVAIADQRQFRRVLAAVRSGGEDFAPLPATRAEVEALAQLFRSDARAARILLGPDASEPELDRLAAAGDLGHFGVIHLATHAVIDEAVPARSAAILCQTELPDPLEQALHHRPVFDGRLSVREIQRTWDLQAELVTLSACETALGRQAGGEGFVGFTQALLIAGARSVCLSLWKVDDRATALLMARFYRNWLGQRPGLDRPLAKAEALREAKASLRGLTAAEARRALGSLAPAGARPGEAARGRPEKRPGPPPAEGRPFAHPHYWAGFILMGDPN
jgi:tetratricopeptide (TPR) repeat protein